MSANQVIDKILSEAKQQAEQIKKQADEKIAQEKQKFEAALDTFEQETKHLTETAAKEATSRTASAARMEIAKQTLKVKRELLDETFADAGEKIKAMPKQDYQNIMERLITAAVKSGDEEIVLDKNESRINGDFIDYLNNKANYKLQIAGSRAEIGAGFMLQKGKVRVNASLKVLLEMARESLQTELAGELFK